MSDDYPRKPIPRSILIFGAGGHIAGPMARYLSREAPQIQLRLVSSRAEGCDKLRGEYPGADVVQADYHDLPSLEAAMEGMEGIFFITNGAVDEQAATTNFIAAAERAGSVVHILRFVGFEPEANLRRRKVPPFMQGHHIAKKLLDESDLPVTYVNSGASFMDNVLRMKAGLKRERKVIWHDRLVPYIDPREIGEVAAKLLLSDDARHLYQFHTLNNGHDILRCSEVATMIGDVLGEPIGFDGTKEAFIATMPPVPFMHQLWAFLEYEATMCVVWSRNDFVERMLGRKPLTMRQWLEEHKELLLA